MDENEILIGVGVLNWGRLERISDRYGTVRLLTPPGDEEAMPLTRTEECVGSLVAIVVETRKSRHIGDIALGIGPTTPRKGERITLGQGKLFYESNEVGDQIGLRPIRPRKRHWLDVKALYRCHAQTVRLVFIPRAKKERRAK